MQSQVGLRKHHYEQSQWRWWNSSWAISNPKRWCCESAVLNMPANLENSAVATVLEKVSFHSNPKESETESEVAKSCPTLCDPVDYSTTGSSIHGILQARVLEWVAISFSRGSSWPRDRTQVSRIPGRCFNLWATREAQRKATPKNVQTTSQLHSSHPLAR